jgi:hypothetical protein
VSLEARRAVSGGISPPAVWGDRGHEVIDRAALTLLLLPLPYYSLFALGPALLFRKWGRRGLNDRWRGPSLPVTLHRANHRH